MSTKSSTEGRNEQLRRVLEQAIKKTRDGKLEWRPGYWANTFTSREGDFPMLIKMNQGKLKFMISDPAGDLIGTLTQGEEGVNRALEELFQEAGDHAKKTSQKLESLISSLEGRE